jgi:tRNA threonylcarbamoyladenosine biosynthesis protein TsaB
MVAQKAMTVLAIDTSTSHGSIALLDDGKVLLEEDFTAERGHGSALVPMLQRARDMVTTLDVIAVGLGPGSYAGVRIAIATAMGIRIALGSRLVGIPSVPALESMAPRYLAIGDARRETFYFTKVEDGSCTEGPILVDAAGLRARLAATPDWPVLTPEPLAILPTAIVAYPRAVTLARLASLGRSIVAEGVPEPLYLREPHITQPKAR